MEMSPTVANASADEGAGSPVIDELDAAGLARELDALAGLLHASVMNGASVNFVLPFAIDEARAFWRDRVAPGVAAGDRRLLVARLAGRLVGTTLLDRATAPNQRHRADISKVLVHPDVRRRGIGRRLMLTAEKLAMADGRTLLTLDTRRGDAGEPLYRSLGYVVAGVIPRYCRAPEADRLDDTVLMYKQLGPDQAAVRGHGSRAALRIRDAGEGDLPAILAITNDEIASGTAVWSTAPETIEGRRAWLADRQGRGYPVLVAADAADGAVLGFASFGDFRPWTGYAHTVEHSVYVAAGARGRGVGLALVEALLARAESLGKHAMVAGIDAGNAASIALHARAGFAEVGRLREVGRKFDRWLDLVFMQRLLNGSS